MSPHESMFSGLNSAHIPHDTCKRENHHVGCKYAGSHVPGYMWLHLRRDTFTAKLSLLGEAHVWPKLITKCTNVTAKCAVSLSEFNQVYAILRVKFAVKPCVLRHASNLNKFLLEHVSWSAFNTYPS